MKSFCPHCNYEYDVTDDYLDQEVTCTECQQDFVVKRAKFCTECGTSNPESATKCRKCKDYLPYTIQTNPSPLRNYSPGVVGCGTDGRGVRRSVLDDVGLGKKIVIYLYGSLIGLFGATGKWFFGPLMVVGGLYTAIAKGILSGIPLIAGGILLTVLGIAYYRAGDMMIESLARKYPLRWGRFEKFSGAVVLIGSTAGLIWETSVASKMEGHFTLKLLVILFAFVGIYSIFTAGRIYCARFQEQQENPEELEEDQE